MTKTFVGQNETLYEPDVSVCTKIYFCFKSQNYLFNLSRTIELLTRKLEFSIRWSYTSLISLVIYIYINRKSFKILSHDCRDSEACDNIHRNTDFIHKITEKF